MLRIFIRVALCALFAATAWSQKIGTPEYNTAVQRALDLLNSGKNDEGIVLFEKLFADNPKDCGSAYNITCGYSKKGQLDKAFEWFAKAVEFGFGNQISLNPVDNVTWAAEKDTDLAPMRADPRFAPLVARMKVLKKELDDYVATPAIYVPKALENAAEVPVLVVLHDLDSSKDRVVAGFWKSIADELGFALVAPSATLQLHTRPQEGMAWYFDADVYAAKRANYEKTIEPALAVLAKTKKFDRSRVVLAGEGLGGIVATSLAFDAPERFGGGVLTLNGPMMEKIVAAKGASAGKAGLRVRMWIAKGAVDLVGSELAALAPHLNELLKSWAVQGSAEIVDAAPDEARRKALFLGALKSMLASAKPVDAGGK